MANRIRIAGIYNAIEYAYGLDFASSPLNVVTGAASGAVSLTLDFGEVALTDGTVISPLNTNAPITIGQGTNQETVTPSAVSAPTPSNYATTTVTATFANAHGLGDRVTSGTFGLQEAINAANAAGGGTVVVDAAWAAKGGTSAMIAAATIPNGVTLMDNRTGGAGGDASLTVTLTNAQVKATNSAPVVVVPACGAAQMWVVADMVAENKSGGAAYANGGALALYYGVDATGVLATGTIAATFLTSPTVAHVIRVAGALADTAASSILGKGLAFANPTADFITGTGTVILKIKLRLLTAL